MPAPCSQTFVIGTLMIPITVILVPAYLTVTELGLVNYAWPREAFEARAAELAARLAASPTVALGFMKRNLNAADHAALPDVLDLEADHMTRSMRTEDHKAAAQAFVDKRPPQFSGR